MTTKQTTKRKNYDVGHFSTVGMISFLRKEQNHADKEDNNR